MIIIRDGCAWPAHRPAERLRYWTHPLSLSLHSGCIANEPVSSEMACPDPVAAHRHDAEPAGHVHAEQPAVQPHRRAGPAGSRGLGVGGTGLGVGGAGLGRAAAIPAASTAAAAAAIAANLPRRCPDGCGRAGIWHLISSLLAVSRSPLVTYHHDHV
jgi:hypothetical protein